MKKQIKQIFNPLSGSFDSIQTSDATKDASQLMLLTADESISDWTASPSFQISKANPLQGDASYALAMTTGDKATHNGVAVNPVFRQRTLALTMSYKGVSLNPITGSAKIVLRDQADAIIQEWTLPTITTQDQKFGTTFFMPQGVTIVKAEIESTSTVADEYLQFDNIEISSDLLKSVDVSDLVQEIEVVNAASIATASVTGAALYNIGSPLISYNAATGLFTALRDCEVEATHKSEAVGSNTTVSLVNYNGSIFNGTTGGPVATSAKTSVFIKKLKAADTFSFYIGANASNNHRIYVLATARTKSIVAPTDQVTEKSIAFRWCAPAEYTEATLVNAPIGSYVTGQYNTANALSQCTVRPDQTDDDISKNGFHFYRRGVGVASTGQLPTRALIKIAEPNTMASCGLTLFKDTSKLIAGSLDFYTYEQSSTNCFGVKLKEFNPRTGILTVDMSSFGVAQANLFFADDTIQNNGYICFTASKLAQGVAIPTPLVAYLKDVKPSGTAGGTFTAGAWQTRTLNTVEGDSQIVSLSANQFTLGPGKYEIEASAPAYYVSNHTIKIINILTTDEYVGSTEQSTSANSSASSTSRVLCTIQLSNSSTFEVRHRCSSTATTVGFGAGDLNTWSENVFTQVKITKLS